MSDCFKCGNCQQEELTYFCPAKNDFVIKENTVVFKETRGGWKKGSADYEGRRRKERQQKEAAAPKTAAK